MLAATLVATALAVVTIPLYAALADRVGVRRVYVAGAAAGAVLAFPFFGAVSSASPWLYVPLVVLVLNLVNAPVVSVQQSLFTDMFGVQFRYSGAGVGDQVAGAIGGGLTPLAAAALTAAAGEAWYPAALLMSAACLVALAAGLAATRLRATDAGPDGATKSGVSATSSRGGPPR